MLGGLLTLELPYADANLDPRRSGSARLLTQMLPKIASGELHPAATLWPLPNRLVRAVRCDLGP